MKTRICLAAIVSAHVASPALGSNHELYVQLRWARRAAYYARQDAMLIERGKQKAYDTQRRREAKAAELAARKADRAHPARRLGERPEHREGLPQADMQRLADQFKREHPEIKLRGNR
jgi:hypothetical protein